MAYIHPQESGGYNLADVLPPEARQLNEDEFAAWMVKQLSQEEKQNLISWLFGFLTVKQYAQSKGVSERTVYRWLTRNPEKHNAEKVVGTWRIARP